jgi:hypothetical protein
MSRWHPTTNAKLGVVVFDYNGRHGDSRFLPLRFGDLVQILEECGGWYLGFSLRFPSRKGVFPSNYIHLKAFRLENAGPLERVASSDDPVAQEISVVLREWNAIWKRLYQDHAGKHDHAGKQCNSIKPLILQLIDFRSQIMSGTLPAVCQYCCKVYCYDIMSAL